MSRTAHTASRLSLKRAFFGITLGFVFLAMLILALGTTTFQPSRNGAARSAELRERLLPALESLAGLEEATLKYNLSNLEFVTGRDEETQAKKLRQAAEQRKAIDRHAELLARRLDSADAHELLEEVAAALRTYDDAVGRLQKSLRAGEFDEAMKLLDGDVAKNYVAIEKALTELSRFVFDLSDRNGKATHAIFGEAGAGFAVVAGEVRALAQRSAAAARETAGKIEIAVQKSHEGSGTSEEVAGMLAEMVGQVRTMDSLVAEIATASTEQAQGLEQITKAMAEMDRVTQSNAAGAEESASAAHELSSQSTHLREAVTELNIFNGQRAKETAPGRSASTHAFRRPAPQAESMKPTAVHSPDRADAVPDANPADADKFWQ